VDTEDLVLVGRIARTHGLRGHVVVDPETDFPEERFAPGAEVLRQSPRAASASALRIASARFHKGRAIVAFEGIESIDAAEALGRVELWIRAASRTALPDGEFYHDALIGCRVETTSGETVGIVRRIEGTRSAPLLVVTGETGETGQGTRAGEVLIPFAEAICPVIDPAARRIVIDPPDGLIDVNR
jgi:16S rRNA processing protein RimM